MDDVFGFGKIRIKCIENDLVGLGWVWFSLGRVENPLNSCALFIQTIQVYQLGFVLQISSRQDGPQF